MRTKEMKKKVIIVMLFLVVILGLLLWGKVFANDTDNEVRIVLDEYSEAYKEWLALPEDKKNEILEPNMYDVPKDTYISSNPLKLTRNRSLNSYYNLKDVIKDNMGIRNQKTTELCWGFSTLAMLETNLALSDLYSNVTNKKIYNFSEKHMAYAATREAFLNGKINIRGYNRLVTSAGGFDYGANYLTNGLGAVEESEMPFDEEFPEISIEEIYNKNVTSQVLDIRQFPTYNNIESNASEIENLKIQMKEHIMNYGAIFAPVHGASVTDKCYNYDTAAVYCANCKSDHAVVIVGWDDNYETTNFSLLDSNGDGDYDDEGDVAQPKNKGAWIIKNSWGEKAEYDLDYLRDLCKPVLWEEYLTEEEKSKYGSEENIPLDVIDTHITEINKYEIIEEENKAVRKSGNKGYFYYSYENVNIYTGAYGILNATNTVKYDNIYQYNELAYTKQKTFEGSKIYLANVFEKQTDEKEFLTQVSIWAPETYTCKVYVNPKGSSKNVSDLHPIELQTGESETFGAGYHTLEFLEPIEITGDEYTVVLEITEYEKNGVTVKLEGPNKAVDRYAKAVAEKGEKCFWSTDFSAWNDLALNNEDSTIKAFTISEIENIEIVTPSTKTEYIEGEDFDKSGMIVKANFKVGISIEITDYEIVNGEDLGKEQTYVTIKYEGKTVTQKITVKENSIEKIEIETPPTNKNYIEGQSFDKSGMIVKVIYKDKNTRYITDYEIIDGNNLKIEQTTITIKYREATTTQLITVEENVVTGIEVTKEPEKTIYFAGQNFDKTGMIVNATYKDGKIKEVADYIVKDGNNLKNGQQTVTISYNEKTTTQKITVKENALESIKINTSPNKTKYVEGQDFNKTGMIVVAVYKDGTIAEITDYKLENNRNLEIGQKEVIISYENKEVIQSITVVERAIESVEIKKLPTKKTYTQYKEKLDLAGGVLRIKYNDNSTDELNMTSTKVKKSGFNNTKIGENTITLNYEGKTVQFTVRIKKYTIKTENNVQSNNSVITPNTPISFENEKEEQELQNIGLENIKGRLDSVKAYYYTDEEKKDYVILETEITGLENTINNEVEYYYYLSSTQGEKGIENWVKIEDESIEDDKLNFIINTKDISNYDEVSRKDVLYLYIKGVVKEDGKKEIVISEPMKLKTSEIIEEYVDDVKKGEIETGVQLEEIQDNTAEETAITITKETVVVLGLVMVVIVLVAVVNSRG